MSGGKKLVLALIVVAAVILIVKYRSKSTFTGRQTSRFTGRRAAPARRRERFCGGGACGRDKFTAGKQRGRRERLVGSRGPMDWYAGDSRAPYTAIQNAVDMVRGNPDATTILNDGPEAMKAYAQARAWETPEEYRLAELNSWYAAAERDRIAPFDATAENMTDMAKDTMQAHETGPALDYDTMVTNLVLGSDGRIADNHLKWVNEMSPYMNTTTMKVDNFEPELYLPHVGLRFPQGGVGQYNPLQLTEVGDADLAKNKDFRFNG
ncbi:MAG: hypothetical protein KGL39_10940 [Patescibacteria group bacterium]|nr:hypothetical protein [Patescibacteria group bacterium]